MTKAPNTSALAIGALGKDSNKQVMVDVALHTLIEAAKGKICEKDADEIYSKFRDESGKSDGGQGSNSRAAQISKLKRFIRLGEEMGASAKPVLDMALAIHNEAAAGENRLQLKTQSAYEAILQVVREQLKLPRNPLSESAIRRIMFNVSPEDYETVFRAELKTQRTRSGRR